MSSTVLFPNFPLYNSLKAKVLGSNKLSSDEKNEIINKVKNLKLNKEYEVIYAIIKAYALENKITEELPYNCSQTKTGYKFDLDFMPVELTHILLEFVRLNLE